MSKPENVKCPECQGPMVPRNGQFGKFWGCRRYPSCTGTRDSEGMSRQERRAQRLNTEDDEDERPEPSGDNIVTFKRK